MKTLSSLLKKQNANPESKLTLSDLMEKRKTDNEKFINKLSEEKNIAKMEKAIGRSGILPLHKLCTTYNYTANTPEQKAVKQFAHYFAEQFDKNAGSGFIFSGESGTGKNHLSAAICNKLLLVGKTCLIITVTELMIKMRKCYSKDPEYTEDEFIEMLIKFDLLIIDEVGLQKGSDHEKIILNQIVDQRISRFKPTGMLTNKNAKDLNEILGVRIMDRMRMNGGQWFPFQWESYRK